MNFGNFEVPGVMLSVAYGMLMLSVIGLIVALRYYFHKKAQANQKVSSDTFASKNKYPAIDALRMNGTFFNIGLLVALSMVLFAFGWTQYEKEVFIPNYYDETDEIEVNSPRTKERPKPPPPPPPPLKIEIAPNEEVTDTIEFIDPIIKENFTRPAPVAKKPTVAPPPIPRPVVEEEEAPYIKIAEVMPSFKGCEEVENKEERKDCAEQKMLKFIYKHIKYPAIARENGIEGMVVIQFIVNKDGTLSDYKIVRDIGGGCGEEALRVVQKMPIWNPGKQRGRPVRVQFNLPVKYQLSR